jgi:cytoskeletal protein RodZ
METIGSQLRAARHAKQASLEDVARVTKIKLDVLEKLEADEFTGLPAPMYVKAFLKKYGEYLGLDGGALADEYLRSQGGLRRQGLQLETEATLRARRNRELALPLDLIIKLVAGATLIVLLVLAARAAWRWRTERKAQPAATKPTLPPANVAPYYQPKKPIPAETLDVPGK